MPLLWSSGEILDREYYKHLAPNGANYCSSTERNFVGRVFTPLGVKCL
jgi:hypothetical protein